MPKTSLRDVWSSYKSRVPSNVSSAEKQTVYGSLFLLAMGGTLLWVCHFIQYRAIKSHLQLHFAGYPSATRDRVLAAASVPYFDSFIVMFVFGLIFLSLGSGGVIWALKDPIHIRSASIHSIGVLLQIPQFIILHATVSESTSPQAALTALLVGLSLALSGVLLVIWSLTKSFFVTRIQAVLTKLCYLIGNILASVSLISLCTTSNPRIGLILLSVAYSSLIVSLLASLIVYKRYREASECLIG